MSPIILPVRLGVLLLAGGLFVASAGLNGWCQQQSRDIEVLKKRLQAELNRLHKTAEFPGATAAVVLPDGTLLGFATGDADRSAASV